MAKATTTWTFISPHGAPGSGTDSTLPGVFVQSWRQPEKPQRFATGGGAGAKVAAVNQISHTIT
ncbi:MAG: hypothetical protein IT363_11475 [Methanoregulaceae archaeon]|jgi:hypothetical protein|nr:hypothetical protein [Methanoregulaceae archaeon]